MENILNTNMLPIKMGQIDAFVFTMKVKDLDFIQYVARRGSDDEKGAVQRMLSTVRLKSIESYILGGNIFYTPFFINWTNSDVQISVNNGQISIPLTAASAQILDGQHRMAGLELAMKKNSSIGEKEVLVILTNGLETEEAAKIFLNINTEQRPVQKSLIYDLFGLINQNDPDMPVVRANDIVSFLNETIDSPYYNLIKIPGTPRGVGVIDMSTVVSSLKDKLTTKGVFVTYRLSSLERQRATIGNYFKAIKKWYDNDGLWTSKTKNPFLMNAGFIAAIDVLCNLIIPKCAEKGDFKVDTIYKILNFDENLLTRADIKNLDGKSQRKSIYDYMETSINSNLPEENEYSF